MQVEDASGDMWLSYYRVATDDESGPWRLKTWYRRVLGTLQLTLRSQQRYHVVGQWRGATRFVAYSVRPAQCKAECDAAKIRRSFQSTRKEL